MKNCCGKNMNDAEVKMKTSDLCKEIFTIIKESESIKDDQLMKVLEKTHGEEKMDNIKRRKYDIINILENSGIIICHKNEKGQMKYSMGDYNVPNYQQKFNQISSEIQSKKNLIKNKAQTINRLMRTLNNIEQLTKRNKVMEEEVEKITYPFHIVEGDLLNFQKYFCEVKAEFGKGAVMANPLCDYQLGTTNTQL